MGLGCRALRQETQGRAGTKRKFKCTHLFWKSGPEDFKGREHCNNIFLKLPPRQMYLKSIWALRGPGEQAKLESRSEGDLVVTSAPHPAEGRVAPAHLLSPSSSISCLAFSAPSQSWDRPPPSLADEALGAPMPFWMEPWEDFHKVQDFRHRLPEFEV